MAASPLSPAQIEAGRRDGFVSPIEAFSLAPADAWRRALERGSDPVGHVDLEPDPRELTDAERIAAYPRADDRHRAGHEEQMARRRLAV